MKWDVFLVINGHTNYEISLLLADSMRVQAILKTLRTDYLFKNITAFFFVVFFLQIIQNILLMETSVFTIHVQLAAINL